MNLSRVLKKNDVIQANERADEWAGCTLIVSEVKFWGVDAYLKIPNQGTAFVRLPLDSIEYIGEAVLAMEDEDEH